MKEASEIYESLLFKLANELSQVTDYEISIYAGSESDYFRKNFPQFKHKVQVGDNLGERMSKAFEDELEAAPSVVLIGSDCPLMDKSRIAQAFEVLEGKDLVLGPAEDGGYYLIGMNSSYDVFTGVEWSTEKVLKQSLLKAKELGLKVGQLEVLRDLDDLDDYNFYKTILEKNEIGENA